MDVFLNIKNRSTIWSSNFTPKPLSENYKKKKKMIQSDVCTSMFIVTLVIYNSQIMETTYVPTWVDKEEVGLFIQW